MYTIGQISEMFKIPVSTLRYYDREGLFPQLKRNGGVRSFGDKEIEALKVIECLKKSGLEIREIRTFMGWCAQGSGTYPKRRDLFIRQEEVVKEEMRKLEKVLAMIRYKRWYYEEAIKDGNEERVKAMSPDRLPEEMKRENPEIVIIGAAILDVLVRPAGEEVFHTGSSPAEEIRLSTGGDALNEATVLAGLGRRVLLETVTGSDKAGKFITEHCRERGILLPEDCVREHTPTGINAVLVSRDGSRHFLTNPSGTLRSLTLEDIHMPFPKSAAILCFASIFVFPEIGPRELEMIFRKAKEQGMTVCADMTKRKNNESVRDLAPAFRFVDYLLPNDEEAMLLTGENTVEKAAEALRAAGVKNVVIKCGGRGCYLDSEEGRLWIPAEKNVKCLDTTGAGDSFTAGFLHALCAKKSLRECAAYGNLCGAKAVASVGATEWLDSEIGAC